MISAIPIPAHYTLAAAQAGLAELRAASAAWLPQLLDGFLAAPPAQQAEKRIQNWFTESERYPRQLREMDRTTYVAMKRQEVERQQTLLQ